MKDYNDMKAKKWKDELIKKMKVSHKCNECVWGKWNEVSFVCLLPNCYKGLGNFRRN